MAVKGVAASLTEVDADSRKLRNSAATSTSGAGTLNRSFMGRVVLLVPPAETLPEAVTRARFYLQTRVGPRSTNGCGRGRGGKMPIFAAWRLSRALQRSSWHSFP